MNCSRRRLRGYFATADVDPINVAAALTGRDVRLTIGERKVAIDQLTRAGYSGRRIAEILGVHIRTVQRYRVGDRHRLLAGVS